MEATKEAVKENKLEIIVKESGLEPTKAQVILSKFQDYFALAADWEAKAKTINVSDPSQTGDMSMARQGRLYLRQKRIDIENTRKALKEQSYREGKAIDGIANVLKALIIPIEQHLDHQENYVKRQEEARKEEARIIGERKMEEDRLAREAADAKERERVRLENEKLKKEAADREIALKAEREANEKKLAAERAAAEAKRDADHKAHEAKFQAERKEQEKLRAEQAAKDKAARDAIEAKAKQQQLEASKKAAAERKAAADKAFKEKKAAFFKAEAERKEKERLMKLLEKPFTCPHCGKTINLATEVK